MTNNKIFQTLLHLTGVGRDKDFLIELFKIGGATVTNSQIKGWRTDTNNNRASYMSDQMLECFFQGLFIYRDMQGEKNINVFNFPVNNKK